VTQESDNREQAKQYMRHQATKGLADLAALMERTGADWQCCLEGMTEEQAAYRPRVEASETKTPISGEGPKWCAKEVIGHFLLTERSLNWQIASFAGVAPPAGPAPAVRAMGEQSPEYEALPVPELSRELKAFFDETRALLSSLPASGSLGKSFPHPVFGPLNMKEWLAFHRLHTADHIQQIEKVKADPGYPRA
jgi:hypothetical protein